MNKWTTEVQPFGPNRAPLLAGLASDGSSVAIPVAVDPTTGRVLVSASGTTGSSLSVAPLNGQAIIASTGTAVQLGTNTLLNGVVVTASLSNVATIEVGTSSVTNTTNGTGNGYILVAGASMSWAVSNTNALWINGTTGDIVSYAGS